MPKKSSRTSNTVRTSIAARSAITLGLGAAILLGSAASAQASSTEEQGSGTMVIRVEIPERQIDPTTNPTTNPTTPPQAGGGSGGLAGTGMDPGFLILLGALGVVAVGTGATVVAHRRAQAAKGS